MSVELRISSSSFFKCLVYTHVSVGVFTRTPFFPILPAGFDFSTDGALVDAWLYFPGLKVGNIYLLHLSAVVCSCRFCLLRKDSFNNSFLN
jgi:hypothetical protein